jgi:hypothetical protein
MKHTSHIAVTLAALTLIGPAAYAQGTATQGTSTQSTTAAAAAPQTAAQSAEQREKARLEAEAARKADTEQARKDLERARVHMEQVQKNAQQEVAKEAAKVQEELKRVQREMEFYAQGTAALDSERYQKALQAFAEAAALQGAKADGALYWKAFSEYKVQALQEALASLKEIQERHPDSRWVEQALALELEVKERMGKPVAPAATPDEELKLLALDSLLHTDAEQALPMLEKMLNGQQSVQLKRRALFVLSQSKSPRAKEILASVAKNSTDTDLQLEALRCLQMLGGAEDRKLLSDIYAGAKDPDVKGRVVDAMFIQGDARALVDLARKETDPQMRKRIVERLSRMKAKEATDYMLEIINK